MSLHVLRATSKIDLITEVSEHSERLESAVDTFNCSALRLIYQGAILQRRGAGNGASGKRGRREMGPAGNETRRTKPPTSVLHSNPLDETGTDRNLRGRRFDRR